MFSGIIKNKPLVRKRPIEIPKVIKRTREASPDVDRWDGMPALTHALLDAAEILGNPVQVDEIERDTITSSLGALEVSEPRLARKSRFKRKGIASTDLVAYGRDHDPCGMDRRGRRVLRRDARGDDVGIDKELGFFSKVGLSERALSTPIRAADDMQIFRWGEGAVFHRG